MSKFQYILNPFNNKTVEKICQSSELIGKLREEIRRDMFEGLNPWGIQIALEREHHKRQQLINELKTAWNLAIQNRVAEK